MDRHDYDTKEGIEALLKEGLVGLNKLMNARYEAGYRRGERMAEWCILGRWYADTCGNFSRFADGVPANAFKRFPPVITRGDLADYIKRWSAEMRSHIPPAHVRCPECEQLFTMETVHLAEQHTRDAREPASEVAGKTVNEVNDRWQWCSPLQTRWVVGVRCPAWVDLTPHPSASKEEYAKDWVVNKDGWREAGMQMKRDEVIPPDSEISYTIFEWFHADCVRKRVRKSEREFFESVFRESGWGSPAMEEIPNGYGRDDVDAPPWFKVDMGIYFIKIGWRKRVISIDWSDFGERAPDGGALFGSDGVTTYRNGVHAWGEKKCVEYLKKLREAMSTCAVCAAPDENVGALHGALCPQRKDVQS